MITESSTIPNIVIDAAHEEGFNYVEYICEFNGSQAFSVGIKDEKGMFVPIGLPTFLLLKDNQVRYATDIECEQICKNL